MGINADEIDLEFMEQDAEERLTQREALLLGLVRDIEKRDPDIDANALPQ